MRNSEATNDLRTNCFSVFKISSISGIRHNKFLFSASSRKLILTVPLCLMPEVWCLKRETHPAIFDDPAIVELIVPLVSSF